MKGNRGDFAPSSQEAQSENQTLRIALTCASAAILILGLVYAIVKKH